MKKIIPLHLLIYISLVYFLSSCGSGNHSTYTVSKGRLIDSIYKAHADSINRFFNQLSWLKDHPGLASTITEPDTPGGAGKISFELEDRNTRPCSDSLKFTPHNCFIVNNKSNFSADKSNDSLILYAKTNYYLTEFYRDPKSDFPTVLNTYIPGYWRYYNDPGVFLDIKDSVRAEDIPRIEQETTDYLTRISRYKYVVLLYDKLVMYPRLISNETFESGYMLSLVKVFELESHQLICDGLLEITSSDEVEHLFGNGNDPLMKKVLTERLKEDFCQQRNIALFRFLKMIK